MPDRVVTVDLQDLLASTQPRILAATLRPYNPTGLPARWRGGYYVDMVVEAESEDMDASHPHAWEHGVTTPQRLFEPTGGRHTFLGLVRPETPPVEPPVGRRTLVLTVDVGRIANRRMLAQLDLIRTDDGGLALEMVIDAASDNANIPAARIYDALDDHPPGLRAALERRGTGRRANAADPATGWENRRGNGPP